ncbi:hypothetical protein SCP_0806460 [Sparassis crispa]|uniref:Uncharacterized protein n=1 Tax=Sparassis crispa TaxID=139825 RepID=A0A401GV94_9APHY|nr:hypothetical protein SCP_0806460 [Sparassis crispa]GBE86122.1 hypothetical protein SCP_0806460 [Sparassis crispa]
MATPSPSTSRSPRLSNTTVRRYVYFRRSKGIPAPSLSRRPPRCNRGALPPPRGRRGPSKSQCTQLHLPAPSIDRLLRAQAHHDERRRPGRHTGLHPPPRAPPGRRTQTFGGTFIFGGRRACQSHYCRAGQCDATATRCPLLAVVSAPRRLTTPHPTFPQPPSALVDMLRQTTVNDGTAVVASATAEERLRRPPCWRSPAPDAGPRHLPVPTRISSSARAVESTRYIERARTSAAPLLSNSADPLLSHTPVPLLSNAAVPLPSNAPVPFPSNTAMSAQGTSVLVRSHRCRTRSNNGSGSCVDGHACPPTLSPRTLPFESPRIPPSHSSRTCDPTPLERRHPTPLEQRLLRTMHRSPCLRIPLFSNPPVRTLSNPAVRLPSNLAFPFPSNAAIPVPSNAAISSQRTVVMVRAIQRETRNAEQQRMLGRRARTPAAKLLSTPPVPLLSNAAF